jgi:hypothetical protein
MKKVIALILFCGIWALSYGQDSKEKVMEKRAREMHRVIGLSNKEEWKKFIKENYTQALIDKPMKVTVEEDRAGTTSQSSENQATDNLDAKAKIFQQLHDDFGASKITSLKQIDDKIEMKVAGDDLIGTFTIRFEKNKPYLIDGFGIEVNSVER